MANITIEIVTDGNIEQCRDLCNELMAFQKSKATIAPEAFDSMNFDTRLKSSFKRSLHSQLVVVKDDEKPVGYVFSTIDRVSDGDKSYIPDWAPVKIGEKVVGLYPDWDDLPEKVGCLSQLYFRDEYRGMGLGSKLIGMAMEWLGSFPDCDLAFVYISNGNDDAYDLYLRKGFVYSHDVFGGFIKAACHRFKNDKEDIKMGKNYDVMNIGTFKGNLAEKGRVMARQKLNLTGSEISFNYTPSGQYTPFVHAHKLNEEVYIVVSGSGKFMVDGEEFAIQEGSIIRVAPAGERAIKAENEDLVYICIQAQAGSLTQATNDDGIILESKASWMES
ncbi:MAG: GNAT family N-acetyltransferase [Deltaproteobacteria bacterium]|nr:GNAT family N-acetyltransferase [Deltaproteobacteria bacterium]